MLKIEMDTEPGGVRVNWRKEGGDSFLSFHRRDGSLILRIHAAYADERSIVTAAHALNFMLRSKNGSHPDAVRTSRTYSNDHKGDGGQT